MILLVLWIMAFGTVGVLAYAGRFPPRRFARGALERGAGPTWPFAFLFHAAAMTTFLLTPLFPAASPIRTVLFWVGAGLNAIAVVGIVWLPGFLLPKWRRGARPPGAG